MDYDRFSDGKSVLAIADTNIASATTTKGAWINTQFFGSLVVALNAAITSGQIDSVSWDEADADDQSDAAAMDDSFNLYQPGQFPVTASKIIRLGCISKKKYVRLSIVTSGTVNIDVFGLGELGHAYTKPKEVDSSTLETSDINCPAQTADAIVTAPKRTS